MSESIDMLFGDLRSLMNSSERGDAWAKDIIALIELAVSEDRDGFMMRWHPYLMAHKVHLTTADFPPLNVESFEDLAWWEEALPFANFNLSLGRRRLTQEDFDALLVPERLARIRGLDMTKHPEAKDFLLELGRATEPLPLQKLILRSMDLGLNHVSSVVRPIAFENVVWLDLARNDIGHAIVRLLTRDVNLKHLRHLDIARVGLTTDGAQELAREPMLIWQLESLWLDHNPIGPRAAHRLLHGMPDADASNLRTLGLAGVDLGDMIMRLLGQAPVLDTLTSLDLGYNRLSDRGLLDLFSVYSPANLQELRLSCNRITNVGGNALAFREDLENLRVLDLSYNAMNSTTVNQLAKNPALGHLRELILTGNDFNSRARSKLLASPNIHAHITW